MIPMYSETLLRRIFPLLVVGLLAACGLDYPTRLAEGTYEVPSGRPQDGLLERPELQKLVELRIAKKGDSLAAALTSPLPAVRSRAAFELASVIDPISAPGLLGALRDSEAAVRRDAAFALGQFDPDAIEAGLADPGPRREAVFDLLLALGQGAEADRVRTLVASEPSDTAAVSAAAEGVADELGRHLVESLSGEMDAEVRRQLLHASAQVGADRTLPALLSVIPAGVADRRATALAISYLMRRGTESADGLRRLAEYLRDPDPDVRVNAAYGFRWAQDPRLWRPFLGDIRTTMDSWSPREPAAEHMVVGIERSELSDDHARIIRFLLESPDWRIRTNAAAALSGWENHTDPRRALRDALSDPSEHVAIAAARALSNSPPPPVYRDQMQEWVTENPDRTLVAAHLMEGIISNDGTTFAVNWLQRFPTTEVAEWIVGLNSLAIIGTPDVLGLLREAATAESRALGMFAAGDLARRWLRHRGVERSRDWFYETAVQVWETGDPERRQQIRDILEDSLFADRGDLVGDFELQGALRVDDGAGIDWAELTELGRHPRLVLDTDKGRIVLVLDTEEAPLTVQWMTRFARQGLFDGVPFHRVEQNFVIQGGDTRLVEGGRSLRVSQQTEATQIPYVRGTLGMARTPQRDSESSQFFVNHTMSPHLDGAYTAWGWVAEGMHVVDRIQRLDRIRRAVVLPDER